MFHGKVENSVIIADGVCLHDIRVIQFSRGARFLDETDYEIRIFGIGGGKDFQCSRTIQGNLMSQIHNSHAAASYFVHDDEIADYTARCCTRGRHGHRFAAMTALNC